MGDALTGCMGLGKGLSTPLLACAALLGGAAGCSDLGTVGPGTGNMPIGLTCEAELTITGTFEPVGTGLDEEGSCDPIGTWTIQAQVSDPGDCTDIPLEAQYVYTVAKDEYGYLVTYSEDPDAIYSFTKVTIEGPCQGNFEHYSEDGLQRTVLKPYTTNEDVHVFAGSGVFETYDNDQLPPPEGQ